MTDRTELRRLLDEATPRPWIAEFSGRTGPVVMDAESTNALDHVAKCPHYRGAIDADLIAAAVNELPALLDADENQDILIGSVNHYKTERDALRTWQERVALAAGLADEVEGYGVHLEADPDTAAEHVAGLLASANTHAECPTYCGNCGEPLADTPCDHCCGSGCGPGTASGAYEECGWCAGAGKVHVGCAELSYAELCAERDALAAKLAHMTEARDNARAEVERLSAQIEAVRELHERESFWRYHRDQEHSYLTQQDAADDSGCDCPENPESAYLAHTPECLATISHFDVCSECARIEYADAGRQSHGEFSGYAESLWPCPTMRALEGES